MLKFFVVLLAVASIALNSFDEGGQKLNIMKTYRHSAFSVSIPLDWDERGESNDETIILSSKNGKDRITISVMYFKPGIKKAEVRKSFESYLEIRLEAEKTEAEGELMLTDAKITDKGEYLYTKYGGYEKSTDRRFIALVAAEKGKIFTFYIESLMTSDKHINNLAAEIFGSVEIR